MTGEIRKLQKMLRMIAQQTGEIPSVIPDGYFGTQTAEAVRVFQQEVGLPVTGSVDAETWNRILEAYSELSAFSAEPISPDPAMLQVMLNSLSLRFQNIPSVAVSGTCDDETKCALRVIQHCCHTEETGLPDKKTCCYLHELYLCTNVPEESEKKDCIF